MFYEQGVVTVDNDFARFGTKSYATNKINTVEVRVQAPNSRIWIWIWGAIAAFIAVGSVANYSLTAIIFALLFAGLALRAFFRAKKRLYQLYVMTSSSEAQAFQSENADEVIALREAIERAMTAR